MPRQHPLTQRPRQPRIEKTEILGTGARCKRTFELVYICGWIIGCSALESLSSKVLPAIRILVHISIAPETYRDTSLQTPKFKDSQLS